LRYLVYLGDGDDLDLVKRFDLIRREDITTPAIEKEYPEIWKKMVMTIR
jgi:hypothetical protein